MRIKKGVPSTVSVSFTLKKSGLAVAFISPPVWVLTNEAGARIQSGVAAASGSKWTATFTVPSNYIVPDGEETLEIEFSGTNAKGREYTKSKDITLADDTEVYKPTGLIYNVISPSPIVDTIELDSDDLEYIAAKVTTPYDTVLYEAPIQNTPMPSGRSKDGYVYSVNIGIQPALAVGVGYNEPMMLVIVAKVTGDPEPIVQMRPIYVLNGRVATQVNALVHYLDKARLREIDPTLQWSTPEYIHFLQEGIKHINGFGDPSTYWTVSQFPSSLSQYLFAASAFYALNARYLAEGFNAFEFNGLNTQLNMDRRESISYKIEELGGFLNERLPAARAAAIRAYGIGTPPSDSGEINSVPANSAILGLQSSIVSNRVGYMPFNRFRRF